MPNGRRVVGIALVAVVLAGAVAAVWLQSQRQQPVQRGGRGFQSDGPVPVIAAASRLADVPIYLDGVGTTRALNTVTVRPQVDGRLVSINFKEGEEVERGHVLAHIDPTTYKAAYDQAVAKKAQDEAQLANARIDLERYTRLSATNSIARQQLDTQKATVAQLEAQVKLDQAAIDNAKAFLDYTTIRAPIAGRTGIRQVDEGNIVRASDATGIVVITQLQPITVLFNLPQQQLGQVNRAIAQGPLTVEAFGADNRTIVDRGVLQVVDNQVDPATGTIRLKSEFPNRAFQLWPGQFVNVRLLVDTLRQVVVAPTAAVQRGPSGTFVYVVQPEGTVAVRPVSVSTQDEAQSVFARGLQAGERVVTTGFARLTAGTRVTVTDADSVKPPSVEPVQTRRERRGQGRERRSEAAPSTPR
jgi:membrane fusion protein, multidrug efflux system